MSELAEHQEFPSPEMVLEMIGAWPLQAKVGIALFFITGIVGGNVIMHFSLKRRGIPYWKMLLPTPSGLRAGLGLNKKEWLALALVAFIASAFATWGMSGIEL